MKNFAIGAVMLTAALFTFQPAMASTTEAPTITETNITAPMAVLTADSPTVTTEPAPVAPVAAPEPVAEPVVVTTEPVVVPAAPAEPVVAPVEPVVVPVPTPTPTEPVVAPVEPVAPVEAVCMEDMPCWDCATMGNLICGREEGHGLAVDWTSAKWGPEHTWTVETARDRYVTLQPATAEHREGFAYIPSVVNPAFVYVFSLVTSEWEFPQ